MIADLPSRLPPEQLFIDGAFVAAHSGRTIPVLDPARGVALAAVQEADEVDVDRAVHAARRALQGEWSRLDASARGRLLWRIADRIEQCKDELAELESRNNGKTKREALRGDLPPAWDIFRYYAGWAGKLHGETIPVDGPYLNYTLREPVGVVGQIIPWNYPLLMAAWKLAPALCCGNTVVLKPSELTPLTALRLMELLAEVGVPPGVVNLIPGFGPVAGAALARHPGVDKLAFTGSIRTARTLLQASAESNLKKLSLELGGKSPNIVFADAPLEAAVEAAFWGIFANKGEVCSAGSRLLVERPVHRELVERLVARARAMRLGDPLDPATEMGSLISRRQLDTVLGYVEAGVKGGARLLCGGERDLAGSNARGWFVKPTLFDEVRPEMKIAQEEIFGPVLAVIPFDGEEEAVQIANGTIYGLVSALWTRDLTRAHRLARRLRAGSVWINDWNGFDSASPFGGVGQSGWGREMGLHALEHYSEVKSIWVRLDRG